MDAPLLEPTEGANGGAHLSAEPKRYTYPGGSHAAGHEIIQLAPLELMIDNSDFAGLSTTQHHREAIPGPAWFVHDGIDGGIGFSKAIYENIDTLAARTRDYTADCDCGRRGCPLCIMSEDCGNRNDPLDSVTGGMIPEDLLVALEQPE